jgi:hypothetical protein
VLLSLCAYPGLSSAQDEADFSSSTPDYSGMNIVRTPVVAPAPHSYPTLLKNKSDAELFVDIPEKFSEVPRYLGFRGHRIHAPRFGQGPLRNIGRIVDESISYQSTEDSLLNVDLTQTPDIIEATVFEANSDLSRITVRDGIEVDFPPARVEAESMELDRGKGMLRLDGNLSIVSPGSQLTADSFYLERAPESQIAEEDRVKYRLVPNGHDPHAQSGLGDGVLEVYNLHFAELKRAFSADSIKYDSVQHTGEFRNLRGFSDPFYFGADRITIHGPSTFEAHNVWVTTCDLDHPHYRIRFSEAKIEDGKLVLGRKTKLQLGKKMRTFFVFPKIKGISYKGEDRLRFELETGRRSELGYYINFAQWYSVTPNVDLAYRLYPSANEGLGIGLDGEYDFMDNPASRLFGSTGEFQTLYTTEERGYTQWYHRQELTKDLTMLAQWEQWYDRDFVKDFYYDTYENRTGPRSFVNLTYLKDDYIVTGSASKATHDFGGQTEKLPEATFHLFDRELAKRLYLSIDSAAGHYNHVPSNTHSQRYSQIARLSYDINLMQGLNIIPFVEGSATHYSNTMASDTSDTRTSGLAGITTQMRFQRNYRGFMNFDSFKHIVVPSVTYFHENSTSMDPEDVPRFDSLDNRPSRERIEAKIDNLVLGRNSRDGKVWPVAQLGLYSGTDLSNEIADATDYEVDFIIRPRPWWGIRTFAETHELNAAPGIEHQQFDRIISYVFFNDNNFENSINARIGYALTELDDDTITREILYGVGYKFSKKWSMSADHTYDLEDGEIRRQAYNIHRRLHKWDAGLRLRDRPSGTDINVVLSLVGLKGAELNF